MPCRRVSFSGSSPRTGRSRSSSIRSGWPSGSRSRSPVEIDSRHYRARTVPLGDRVPRAVRLLSPVFGAILALAVPPTIIRGAVPLSAPDGQVGTAAQEASPGPTPPGGAPPAPAPSPTPAPPAEAAPSPQDRNRGPETGQESPEPGGGGESGEAATPEAP